MQITNAVIIYFTLGVPFGVLSVYIRKSRLDGYDLIRVIYHLAFWPLIAFFQFILKIRQGSEPQTQFDRSGAVAKIGRRRLKAQGAVVNGLKQALQESNAATELCLPFAETIDHPKPELAAKCFHRRNIHRLKRHVARAEQDYSNLESGQFSKGRQDRLNGTAMSVDGPAGELC